MLAGLPLRKPRSRAKAGPAFVFVETSGVPSTGLGKNEAKTIVRQQAARAGRTRRQGQTASQETIGTLPNSQALIPKRGNARGTPEAAERRDGMWRGNPRRNVPSLGLIMPQPVSSEYETFRAKYNFDVTDLTSFTDVDLATNACRLLRDEPHRLASLLQKRHSSFLAELPSRYGASSTCLDDAMHCVAAKAGQMLGFPMPKSTPSVLYGRALRSLQAALWDIEEMHRNEPSMFASQEWQRAFQRASGLQSDTDCRLWWKLFATTAFLPGILKDLRSLLEEAPHRCDYSTRISAIYEQANSMHDVLHNDHVMYQHAAPHPQSLFGLPTSAESPDRIRLRVFFIYTMMYVCRVLATLSPSELERATSEVEAQTFASQALLIEEVTTELDPAMAWHVQQRNSLAYSITQENEEAPIEGFAFVRENGHPYGVIRSTGNSDQQSLLSEYEIFRDDLSRILYDKTKDNPNISCVFGEQISSLQHGEKDNGPIKVGFATTMPPAEYDLVVACDGATSRTRALGLGIGLRDHARHLNVWAAYFSTKHVYFDGSKLGHAHNAAPGNKALKKYAMEEFGGMGWIMPRLMREDMEATDDFYAREWIQVNPPTLPKGRFTMVGDAGYDGAPGAGTSLALADGYVLAGELSQSKGDVAAGLKAYEDRIRPIFEDMHKLPSGGMSFMAPQTQWWLALRNTFFAFLARFIRCQTTSVMTGFEVGWKGFAPDVHAALLFHEN
ncbi:uncharacterized protein J7T54_001012 [Emericellopsis cladophorae]|uniref:FAD-binding domain-containing protein n=1 Tax=Emericellopsis cladophorae TaxID=2686198 RepID=A0A9Q0BAY6_9HYPO|nr:uncharacterized protein J7T54_001012 [Emericellopsis cladophorae]KAI6779282.1 hypothetical protein J7T54_001012 [Emericellopsis cladophorae]